MKIKPIQKFSGKNHRNGLPRLWRQPFCFRGEQGQAGLEALIAFRQLLDRAEAEDAANASWSPEEASQIDCSAPVWCLLLDSFPRFISEDRRWRCKMLAAFPGAGAPLPDWQHIHARAIEEAQKMNPFFGIVESPFDCGSERQPVGGRAAAFIPSIGLGESNMWLSIDKRRIKRRAGSAPPAKWAEQFGSAAPSLWSGGASFRGAKSLAAQGIAMGAALHGLAKAVAEHTGAPCKICPGFFEMHPRTIDDLPELERVDELVLDPVRQAAAIGASAKSPDAGPSMRL